MSLDPIVIDTAPHPVACIVLMHGLGADGSDFVPIAQELDLSAIGPVRFIFPSAPVRPVTINGGYEMRAWYDILDTDDLTRREDETSLRASQRDVQALIDREIERGIPSERIVLMGFSQGCAMTLMTGLRAPQRLAGLVGLSGYLPLAAATAAERNAANRDLPIFLAHGHEDAIVAFARGTAAREALITLGHPVEWHDYPMDHEVCLQEIEQVAHWINDLFGAVKARRE